MSALIDHCEIPDDTRGACINRCASCQADFFHPSKHDWNSLCQPKSRISVRSYLIAFFLPMGCLIHSAFFAGSIDACCFVAQREHPKQTDSALEIETINALIQQLGDNHYIVRDEAESELLKIGGPAIEPLRNATTLSGTEAPDGEIQLRATRLLILIEREDRERGIRLFLEGKDTDLELAGWGEFSKTLEPNRQSRRIFVDMYQAQPKLFAAIKKGKRELETVYQFVSKRSLRSNSNSNATQSAGTMNALMFVAALQFSKTTDSQELERISISQNDLRRLRDVVTQSQMVTYVNNCGNRKRIEKIISKWLAAIPDGDAESVGTQLAVIKAYDMNSQTDTVIQFAADQKLPTQTRVKAIEIIASLGVASQLPKLDTLLQEATVVGSYLPQIPLEDISNSGEPNFQKLPTKTPDEAPQLMQVQIRDLSLIAAIKISGQDVAEYGFQPKCFSRNRFVRNLAGFYSQTSREEAFKTWNEQN